MAELNVIPLRDQFAPLNDLPGRLRMLAQQIESGDFGDVSAGLVIFQTRDEREPMIALLGSTSCSHKYYYVGMLADASHQLLKDSPCTHQPVAP